MILSKVLFGTDQVRLDFKLKSRVGRAVGSADETLWASNKRLLRSLELTVL